MQLKFEWDAAKASANFRKHRVSFETALRVFADPCALSEQDRIENGERRWRILGHVDAHLLLLVAYTVRYDADGSERIRIISARRAEPKERKRYEQIGTP